MRVEATLKYTDLRNQTRIDLSSRVPLQFPLSLYIEPTNRCNFKCKFCPESFENFSTQSGGFHFLDMPKMEKIVDSIADVTSGQGVKTINFYMMGEPLLNKDISSFIKLCREFKSAERLIVTTNGSLLKGERARLLAANPPDYLRVSIYGPNSEIHNEVTKSRIPLEEIRENIKSFKELNRDSSCTIYVKMIDQGKRLNEEFLQLFSGIADELNIEPVMNWNDPEEGNLSGVSKEELLNHEYFTQKKEICPSPFYVLVIHSDLQVSVCCVDWAKKATVGNLERQSLKEIWEGKDLRDFQLTHLRGKRDQLEACKNCTYLHTFPDSISPIAIQNFTSGK